jgi:hypothetical protein
MKTTEGKAEIGKAESRNGKGYVSTHRIVMRAWAMNWREDRRLFREPDAMTQLCIRRAKAWRDDALEAERRAA